MKFSIPFYFFSSTKLTPSNRPATHSSPSTRSTSSLLMLRPEQHNTRTHSALIEPGADSINQPPRGRQSFLSAAEQSTTLQAPAAYLSLRPHRKSSCCTRPCVRVCVCVSLLARARAPYAAITIDMPRRVDYKHN